MNSPTMHAIGFDSWIYTQSTQGSIVETGVIYIFIIMFKW